MLLFGFSVGAGAFVIGLSQISSFFSRCVIEVFGGVCVLSLGFRIFCWYRGVCHRTGSDLLLFLFMSTNL